MKVLLRLAMLAMGVALMFFLGRCAESPRIDSSHKPTEEEYWEFRASVSPGGLENSAEIDVTQIEFLIYAEDEEKSLTTGEPVVGELSFSLFAQRSETTSNGVAQGEVVFRRPTKNFFLAVNEDSLPEGTKVDCEGLQYFEWGTKAFGFGMCEDSEK